MTKANFYDVVLDDPNLWLVEYMSPRCGTCQEMSPVWQEFVSKNSGKAKFGQVDIDDKGAYTHSHPSTCIRRTTGLKGRGTHIHFQQENTRKKGKS